MAVIEWEKQDSDKRAERLQEVYDVIQEAKDQISDILRGTGINEARAKSYWYAELCILLNSEHVYLASTGCTMERTIEGLKEFDSQNEEEEEDGISET
jgi:hypothetical protein